MSVWKDKVDVWNSDIFAGLYHELDFSIVGGREGGNF